MKNVLDKSCRENQTNQFIFINFFTILSLLWDVQKNKVEPDKPQMKI